MSVSQGGSRLGPRIADLISQALISTHHKLLGTKRKLALIIFNDITNEISDETNNTVGDFLKHWADQYGDVGHAAGLLNFMAYGRGQLKAMAGGSATASTLLWALGSVISNELAPLVYTDILANPHLIPDPGTIATLAAQGYVGYDEATRDIGKNGYAFFWADAMVQSAKTYVGMSEILDLYRRGDIDDEQFVQLATKSGWEDASISLMKELRNTPISAQDAAVAFMRGQIGQDAYKAKAEASGMSWPDAQIYLESIGEPPGTMELLEAFRRGFIDDQTLERGILQSRTRNEWIDTIKQLRYSPMSTADAVNAVVQGHIEYGAGQAFADQNGLEPGQFDTLYQTAGEPLSRTELEQLYNRGLVSEEMVKQGLRESRLKNKYVDDAFLLHEKLLEPRMLSEAVVYGALTHEDAVKMALDYGFSPEHAETLVASSALRKLQTRKEKILSAAETMYEDNGIDETSLLILARDLGFDEGEANFVVKAAEYHRQSKIVSSTLSSIRGRYVGHHLTEQQTSAMLDTLGIPSAQRDSLLKLWTLETIANVRSLTPAQVLKAVALQLITTDEGQGRLEAMGYASEDAALLLAGA